MIGNITKGNGFYGCVSYVLGKQDAQLINTNMGGTIPAQLAKEFRIIANKNERVKKPVLHLSFSPAPGDRKLDPWELCQIARDLMLGLNLDNNQFILVQHNDAEYDGKVRPHAHLVINRVEYNGRCNDDYLDYYRTEKLLRKIEKDYNLIIQPSSWEVDKKKAYPHQQTESNQPNVVEKLQKAIEQAAADQPEMPVFVERLQQENIQVNIKFTRTGKLKGISYCLDGQAFKGGDLGKLYTHIGLREHLKVSYKSDYQHQIENLINNYQPNDNRNVSSTSSNSDSSSSNIATEPIILEVQQPKILTPDPVRARVPDQFQSKKTTIKPDKNNQINDDKYDDSPIVSQPKSDDNSDQSLNKDAQQQEEINQQQQLYASQIASTIRAFWLLVEKPQSNIIKTKNYELELVDETIIMKRKDGETIAAIPENTFKSAQGIALNQQDLVTVAKLQQKIDEWLSSEERTLTTPRKQIER